MAAPQCEMLPGLGWNLPPVQTGTSAVPVHPHLHPIRSSRVASSDTPSKGVFNSTLTEYRINLYKTLDSERWGHQGTVNRLKTEQSRRESAEKDIETLKQQLRAQELDCESLRHRVKSSDQIILERDTERFSLYQEVIRLHAELHNLQAANESLLLTVRYHPITPRFNSILTSTQHESDQQRLMLDMTPAKDRQIQVLRKRLSRQPFDPEQKPAAMLVPLPLRVTTNETG